jgi:carboxyl-terminal processing protease
MRKLVAVVAAASLSLLTACAASTTNDNALADCSVAGENAQIFATMQSWYYWYQSLPAVVDPTSYSSAAALLDAVRQQPLDRFSYVTTQAADQAFYSAGQYVGYGIGFELSPANELEVTRVFPGSPAAGAGLARGDTVTAINGTAVPALVAGNQLEAALSAPAPGVTVSLTYQDLELQASTVTLTAAVVTSPSVAQVALLPVGDVNVGYILFDSFITPSTAELDQAFAQLASQGATRLVFDERYNGGGELQVAQHLASLIAGNGYAGKVLGTLSYNDLHPDQNVSISFQPVANSLNLSGVYFITSDGTASASEFVINALKPYLDVVTVGGTSFGKPVGEDGFDVCSDVLYPITFKIENAAGAGDYFDGLAPTCAAADDLTHALGDPAEASLSVALGHIATGSCGPNAAAAVRANAQRQAARPRRSMRYDWRRLVGAY